jgi:long-subunit acyl-CoA synthetase (AMP-forming)
MDELRPRPVYFFAPVEWSTPPCTRGRGSVRARARSQEIATRRADHATLRRIASGVRPSDPVCIQYTSGTTGSPKGATLTHTNILNNWYFVGEGLGYTEHNRVCIPVPFYHCFGIHR